MKKLHSSGYNLVQNEETISFASFSEKENITSYYRFDGKDLYEISKEEYLENKLGEKWEKITKELSNKDFSYYEGIAKCWTREDGDSKLISLMDYYNNNFGLNREKVYNLDIFPKDLIAHITGMITCSIRNEKICLFWPNDTILHFNEEGKLVQYISLEASDHCDTLYQICSDGKSIWGVSPTMNTIVKYQFPSFKLEKTYHYTTKKSQSHEEMSNDLHVIFTENKLAGLNHPEGISYIDGQYYICDMENKRIVAFNPDNGSIEPYISLDSKPFEFLKWKSQFIIRTDMGIYLLDEND